MIRMNNRVYGIIGIGSYMANWNADFTNQPKTLGNGMIFGSDKALKYSIRYHMVNKNEKVLYYKTFKDEKEKLQPLSLDEKYKMMFGEEIIKDKNASGILRNLFSTADIINFGATYAGKVNISILGIVQIGQAFNKFGDTEIHTQNILSPFRDGTKTNADATTLGTHTITDEAHYVYPFVVNPKAIDNYKRIIPELKYTIEDYNKFKRGALEGATLLNTVNKIGCENEVGLFITVKEDSELYIPSLDSYIEVYKDDKVVYNFMELTNLLNNITEEIEEVELFYNPLKIRLEGIEGFNYNVRDIVTKKAL